MPEAQDAGQQADGEDRHDGSVEDVREAGHRLRVSAATRSVGTGGTAWSRDYRFGRSARRSTNWIPWKASVIDADLLSTSPAPRPAPCTFSKVVSVSTLAARLGHAIHRRPAGSMRSDSDGSRRSMSEIDVEKRSTTSMSFPGRRSCSMDGAD